MDKKILIVDDAVFMRTIIGRELEEAGYRNLLEAKDGREACSICAQEHPALVLMDISMPVMNGIEALKNIRRTDKESVVIICSAMGQETMLQEAAGSGAADFIVKPFSKEDLIKMVEKYL